ncbi:MAG: hypothetical protein J7M38_15795 [Armatimonadetes bacterium]|nr:hypothetical protein [Armatimonadota bacterium]
MTEPTRTETIVCFGTSITFGTPYVSREDAWPAILERRLNQRFGAAGVQVTCINSGVPGHNTAEGLERIQSDVLSHDPDVVIIEFSCNDVRWEPEKRVELEQFRENLLEMVRLIRGVGADIVITTPSPIVDAFHVYSQDIDYYDPWGGCNNALMEYDTPIREVAEQEGLTLCDIRAAFEDIALRCEFEGAIDDASDLRCLAPWIKPEDGVHPTLLGQQVYAFALYRILRKRYL